MTVPEMRELCMKVLMVLSGDYKPQVQILELPKLLHELNHDEIQTIKASFKNFSKNVTAQSSQPNRRKNKNYTAKEFNVGDDSEDSIPDQDEDIELVSASDKETSFKMQSHEP